MPPRARYELKYVVDEDRARAITRFVRMHLQPSAYNRWAKVPGQPIISLYFDSPSLLLFRQNAAGQKNRMKLRIRFYDDDRRHPAFLEIKRRVSDVICKERAVITRDGVDRLLLEGGDHASHWPDASCLLHRQRDLGTYFRFWEYCNRLDARGLVYVSYLREAYESPTDDKLRVTLDRDIHGTVYDHAGRLVMPEVGVPPRYSQPPYNLPPGAVVLEMKYDERPPLWMLDLVRLFNLERRPVSKFWLCVDGTRIPEGRRLRPELLRPLLLRSGEPRSATRPASPDKGVFLQPAVAKINPPHLADPAALTSPGAEDSVTHVRGW